MTNRSLLSVPALLIALALHAFAADGTWISTSSAAWNTNPPWSGGNIADGSGSTAFRRRHSWGVNQNTIGNITVTREQATN